MNPTAATVLLAAAFVSPALQAQEPPAPPPPVPQAASKKPAAPKELEEIVVVATRRAEDPYDVPQATDVVSGKRLKERPPATFGDVFRGVPGVWQTESGNGRGKTPVIRGLTGNQILTLFDGRRLNNAMFPPPGPFTLHDTIDPEDIERVEVLKGPGSVLYGTGAVGGVVNVIPKEPPSFTPGGTLGGELRLRGSSADNGFRTRMVGEGATAGTRFRVGATHETLGDLRTGDGLILSPLAQQSQHLDGTFYLATGEDSNLRFRGEFSRLDSDRDFLSPGTPRTTTTDRSSWGLTWNRENLGSPLADKIKLRLWNATWDSTSTRFDRLDRRARKVDTWGVDLQADSKWREGQRWTWGMEAYIDQASDLRILSSGPENGVPDGNQLHVAGYAQDELKVLDDLEIVAGLRGNFFRTTTSPRAATLPAGIRLSEADIAENEFTFTGSLGAVAHLSDAVSLAANGGRGFRVPGIRDLAGVNAHPDGVNVGNPGLAPEESWTADVGLRVETGSFRGSVSGFHTWLRNLITSRPGRFNGKNFLDRDGDGVPDPNEMVAVATNRGRAEMTGAEAEAQYGLGGGWSLAGTFSWVIGRDLETREPLRFVPPANGTLAVRFDEPGEGRWWTEFEVTPVRKQARIPNREFFSRADFRKNPQDPASPPLRSTSVLPGYTLFSWRAGVRLDDRLDLTVAVENLGDKTFRPLGARHDGAGVNFIVALSAVFGGSRAR